MSLTSAEHAAVRRASMDARNRDEGAWRRAWDWVDRSGARVTVQERPEGPLYSVRVVGFHPAWAQTLPDAVDALRANVERFLASGALEGPTKGRLDRLREALGGN